MSLPLRVIGSACRSSCFEVVLKLSEYLFNTLFDQFLAIGLQRKAMVIDQRGTGWRCFVSTSVAHSVVLFGRHVRFAATEMKISLPEPKLWSTSQPHLYDLQISLNGEGDVVDEVASYFGMRKVSLGKDKEGRTLSGVLQERREKPLYRCWYGHRVAGGMMLESCL